MPPKPEAGVSQQWRESFFRKKCHRQKHRRRIGEKPNDQRANLRIFFFHPKESNQAGIEYTVKTPVAENSLFKISPSQRAWTAIVQKHPCKNGIRRDRSHETNWTPHSTKSECSICTWKPWRDSKRYRHQSSSQNIGTYWDNNLSATERWQRRNDSSAPNCRSWHRWMNWFDWDSPEAPEACWSGWACSNTSKKEAQALLCI